MRALTVLLLFPLLLASCKDGQTPAGGASTPAVPEKASEPPEGMVWIPGGTYTRGEDRKISENANYPEEQPVHEVTVDGFFMDITEVTNADYLKFTEATGYKTQAELGWSKEEFPKAPEGMLVPGALVFTPPEGEVPLWREGAEWQWWKLAPGANWRHPTGPGSSIEHKMDHPVVCLTHDDAAAYAKWAGKRLPTEAEWERAARGGGEHTLFLWGNEKLPGGKWLANAFQGTFPHNDTGEDGYAGTSPVKSFPPNAYGLYDMVGNAWEHCSDYYRPEYYSVFARDPHPNPKGPSKPIDQMHLIAFQRTGEYPKMAAPVHPLAAYYVVKGGSFLCHESYCLRFRPAARHYSESLSPTNHTGFRCVKSAN